MHDFARRDGGLPYEIGHFPMACFVRRPRRGRCIVPKGAVGMDIVYIGLTVGFFVASWAVIVACERLS